MPLVSFISDLRSSIAFMIFLRGPVGKPISRRSFSSSKVSEFKSIFSRAKILMKSVIPNPAKKTAIGANSADASVVEASWSSSDSASDPADPKKGYKNGVKLLLCK